ncbi:hypothetical protein PROFUN_05939 [Planoprotostelium fungivorum]|uniref:ornithine decarboxylase n=1 Tax=Planoprotostelium fungivorum TaxID=1890364 RepID=A0A2P6N7N2_9EUKA|nr:hypothetical protein PROFUN_05939 [Planoprotostelium fungivorum]
MKAGTVTKQPAKIRSMVQILLTGVEVTIDARSDGRSSSGYPLRMNRCSPSDARRLHARRRHYTHKHTTHHRSLLREQTNTNSNTLPFMRLATQRRPVTWSFGHPSAAHFETLARDTVSASCEDFTVTQYKVPKDVNNKWSVEATGDRNIEDILSEKAADREDAFFIIDLGRVTDKYKRWKEELPTVKPFFAIKCNPNTAIIRTLASLGTGFDCASMTEMRQVLGCGVSPSDIIFANPTKMRSHIEFAKGAGIKLMTFDNRDELVKVHSIYPEAELVLRIITDDSHSVCGFSSKFGAPMSSVEDLLSTANSLGCTVRGVSFHVGSNCLSPLAFEKAITSAAAVFRLAEGYGYRMDFLDLGGGWPGVDGADVTFSDMAAAVRPLLPLFPPHVRVIAEPGRYFVADSHTLAVNVFAKRATDEGGYLYYVNDGVYQSFNCIYFDHYSPRPRLLRGGEEEELHRSTLFGPTCDSIDCVAKDIYLPELNVGDWLYFTNMGAYTVAAASSFNGFDSCPTTFYIESDV